MATPAADVFAWNSKQYSEMQDSDTATLELSKAEAREAINALAEQEALESGRDEERTHNVKEILKREFDFEGEPFDSERDIVDQLVDVFDEDVGGTEIQLSRSEATEIDRALGNWHEGTSAEDADTIAGLRDRLAETYDLDRRT